MILDFTASQQIRAIAVRHAREVRARLKRDLES